MAIIPQNRLFIFMKIDTDWYVDLSNWNSGTTKIKKKHFVSRKCEVSIKFNVMKS
jgi:hypothetical protein